MHLSLAFWFVSIKGAAKVRQNIFKIFSIFYVWPLTLICYFSITIFLIQFILRQQKIADKKMPLRHVGKFLFHVGNLYFVVRLHALIHEQRLI